MASEQEFPKINGDILFASEVNRFAGGGRFLAAGSTTIIASGTAAQDLGSFIIGAGSLSNPYLINFYLKVSKNTSNNISIQFSGTSTNAKINIGAGLTGQTMSVNGYALTGSPHGGVLSATAIQVGAENVDTGTANKQKVSSVELNTLDPEKDIMVKMYISGPTDNTQINAFNFQAFRGKL